MPRDRSRAPISDLSMMNLSPINPSNPLSPLSPLSLERQFATWHWKLVTCLLDEFHCPKVLGLNVRFQTNPTHPTPARINSVYISLFDYIIKTPEHQLVYSWYSSALPFSLTYSCAATNNHLTSVILFAQVAFRVSVALYSHHCTTQRWKPRQVDMSIIP